MKRVCLSAMIFGMVAMGVSGCGPHVKEIWLSDKVIVENKYISFSEPAKGWYLIDDKKWTVDDKDGKAQSIRLYSDPTGATFQVEVETWPFEWLPWKKLFDRNAKYETVLKDEDMKLGEIEKEQGIGYSRLWVNYVQGLKCYESVFSRSHGGVYKDIKSKNYSLTCGYYDKTEGKRILSISYWYSYAGGDVRHQKDAEVAEADLPSVEQVELMLKRAVKQLVGTIRIKNMDRERMEREGLIHPGRDYEIFPY